MFWISTNGTPHLKIGGKDFLEDAWKIRLSKFWIESLRMNSKVLLSSRIWVRLSQNDALNPLHAKVSHVVVVVFVYLKIFCRINWRICIYQLFKLSSSDEFKSRIYKNFNRVENSFSAVQLHVKSLPIRLNITDLKLM